MCGELPAYVTHGDFDCGGCSAQLESNMSSRQAPPVFIFPRWNSRSRPCWDEGELTPLSCVMVKCFPPRKSLLHLGDAVGANHDNVIKRLVKVTKETEAMYFTMVTVRRFTYLQRSSTLGFEDVGEASSGPDTDVLDDESVAAVRQFRCRMEMGLPGYVKPHYRVGFG